MVAKRIRAGQPETPRAMKFVTVSPVGGGPMGTAATWFKRAVQGFRAFAYAGASDGRPKFGVALGGGFARGKVVGRTDRIGGEVVDTSMSPKDILATVYYLLGIDPNTMIPDRLGRPIPVAGEGRMRPELLV